jgi:glycosyltransferase involved in cell wall biosynthesis
MRVMHVISNVELGNIEAMLVRLIQELVGEDISHSVVSLLPGGTFGHILREHGAEVVELEGRRSAASIVLLRPLRAAIARVNPDVVQGWMYHGNIAGSAAAMLASPRPPVIWGIRNTVERLSDYQLMTRGFILAGAALAFHPRHLVYNSTLVAEQHERLLYPKSKRAVIYSGIDTTRFKPSEAERFGAREALGISQDAEVIGRVAHNDPSKDNGTLFRAFRRIAAERRRAHLVLVGSGMDASDPELIELVRLVAAPGRVHFLGPRFKLEQFLPAFDVAVSSARVSKGFPTALAEAMACGVPVVSTYVEEVMSVVDDIARVVPRSDPDALAAALRAVLDQPAERRREMGLGDRRRIEQRFTLGIAAQSFANLWRSVTSEREADH